MLQPIVQEDFSAGSVLNVARHLIDERGARKIRNGLLGEDGSVFKRGGSISHSAEPFDDELRWIWEGYLAPGRRTVFASPDNFGVLDSDDETPLDLGGAGLTLPANAKEINGLLFIGGGIIYGGAQTETADYSTGTVTTTNGSATIEGAGGTDWSPDIVPGMLFRISGERVYVVASVADDDTLTLTENYEGTTAAGKAYTLKRLEAATTPYNSSAIYAVIGDRLITITGSTLRFTERGNPHSQVSDDFHSFEEGVQILGAESIGQSLLVFTTGGITAISNMALSLTDPAGNVQHRLDNISRDLILWGQTGITSYQGGLVVPMLDGVYLLDGVSAPEPISDSILPDYREHVDAGHRPGGAAVYHDHLFLPILDASGGWEDLLICRLDRPVESRTGIIFPWTFGEGAGAQVAALTSRPDSGKLLAAGKGEGAVPGVFDEFDSDSIGAGDLVVQAHSGGGAPVVITGELQTFYSTATLVRPALSYTNFAHTIKFTRPAFDVILQIGKQAGASLLRAQYVSTAGVDGLFIRSPETVNSVVVDPELAETDVRWLRFMLDADEATAELWATDPELGGAPDFTVSLDVTGSAAGSNVLGIPLLMTTQQDTVFHLDDERITSLVAADGGQVPDLAGFLDPEGPSTDHDGSVPYWEIETRDYRASMNVHRWRRLVLIREMEAASGTDPRISADVATGVIPPQPKWDEVDWGEFNWAEEDPADWRALPFGAGPDSGINGYTWPMKRRSRYLRLRLRSSDPVAKLIMRSIEMRYAELGNDRLQKVSD